MKEISLTPRDYQQQIFNTAKEKNTLAVLPTGLGKTLIALMLSVDRLKKHPLSKVLFLAPTKPLVEQHFQTFQKQLPELFADLQLFTGAVSSPQRKKIFQTAEIIFSTPQCIANDIAKELYSLHDISLLIIDEAHRCLKNYDYTKVVNRYKSQATNPLILGLTASPGSEAGKVKEICQHLDIDSIELRTRDSPDVKQYLEEREITKVEVPFPQEFLEIKVLLEKIYKEKVEQLRKRNLLFGPANKITLLKLQSALAGQIRSKGFQAMVGMSLTAQAIKISHAIELLESQTLTGLNEYLQGLVKQAEQKKSKGVQTLVKSPDFQAALVSLSLLIQQKVEHPKIEELACIVEQEFQDNPKAKIIVFAQFRETNLVIADRLAKIPEAKPKVFLGQAKKTNSQKTQSGLSQKEQKQIIQNFRDGSINILCATSIAEEGLDIPEVSAVIFYEPTASAIRKIQRSGRTARLAPGKIITLVTKDTRDIAYHYAAHAREKKMYKTIEQIQKQIKNKPKTLKDFK